MSEIIAALLGAAIVIGMYLAVIFTLNLISTIRLKKLLITHAPYLREDQD